MALLGFSHYNLRAPRPLLERLRDFYVEVVGLREGERPPFRSFGYWLYAGEQAALHLTEAGSDEERPTDPRGCFDHAAFECTDRAVFEARLTQHGIAYRVSAVPLRNQVQLFFSDPAGHGVELNFPT
ncbi:MAG TPA: VOC family protein [Burkholderiaceae bacterium]